MHVVFWAVSGIKLCPILGHKLDKSFGPFVKVNFGIPGVGPTFLFD